MTGVFAFFAYDLLKCTLWMKRIVIKIERPDPVHIKLVEPKPKDMETIVDVSVDNEDEDEEEDITALIKKVRNQKKPAHTDLPSTPPFGQLISELTKISTISMDEFMKDIPEDNKNLMSGMCKIFESVAKGEKPDPTEMKKVREEMSDAFQQLFCDPMTEEDKEAERKDSDIILNRLKEIHNPEKDE